MSGTGDRPLIVSVVGTRPEAIKMRPLVRALEASGAFEQRLVLTGQHSDLHAHFDGLGLFDLALEPAHHSAGELREMIHWVLCRLFIRRPPALVLVQGDTTSALAGALAARDCAIPVGHVEAGLRSGDLQQPWPEEGNRIRIDQIADLLFAPTEAAAKNLYGDREVTGEVHVTGNTGIDALLQARGPSPPPAESAERKRLLVTCHRRENRGETLAGIAAGLKRIVRELPVAVDFLLHTNEHVRAAVRELLGGESHVQLLEPLPYTEMVRLMDRSWAILTDSGGIQEEAPALGKPTLVLRNVTERPEAIATANIELVGTAPGAVFASVAGLIREPELYARMAVPAFPFGDGNASVRIVEIVSGFLVKQATNLRSSQA